ncbi:RWD domain-domain-containing protein [Phakopsora pachyrhizi]|uniref:RWD domain-domain-containing protein n=1 Tax=Phakopsora pachyrhizi TaxID=170000 RepID=A0AAV0BHH8_PHAPC|nr:RWD domain-domain-containing protein [Phakopsora pachyrhizi]
MTEDDGYHSEQKTEEIEVLQSIFEDLIKEEIILRCSPEINLSIDEPLAVNLIVKYTTRYPDQLPIISIDTLEGTLNEREVESTIQKLYQAANESIGMAMIFTLSSTLKDQLDKVLVDRSIEKKILEREDEVKKEIEETKKQTGTKLTAQIFLEWRARFDVEVQDSLKQKIEEQEKSLSFKEREELKKSMSKLTGKQLFESSDENDKSLLESDLNLIDPDSIELDLDSMKFEN